MYEREISTQHEFGSEKRSDVISVVMQLQNLGRWQKGI